MRIRSLGRVYLQLGEALRLEMTSADPGVDDVVHLQYYIATELGPWALWLSSARDDVAAAESSPEGAPATVRGRVVDPDHSRGYRGSVSRTEIVSVPRHTK